MLKNYLLLTLRNALKEGTELLTKMLDFGLKKSKFWNCLKKVILIDLKKRIFFQFNFKKSQIYLVFASTVMSDVIFHSSEIEIFAKMLFWLLKNSKFYYPQISIFCTAQYMAQKCIFSKGLNCFPL